MSNKKEDFKRFTLDNLKNKNLEMSFTTSNSNDYISDYSEENISGLIIFLNFLDKKNLVYQISQKDYKEIFGKDFA